MKKSKKAEVRRQKAEPLNSGKLESFLQQCVARKERAKNLYKSADRALDHVLALDVPLDQPIAVQFRDKKNIITRKLVVKDLFKETNTAWKSASSHRFEIQDYKEPKPAKAEKLAEVEV